MKFFEHALSVMRQYFEVSPDLEYLGEIGDRATAREYIRQLLLPAPPATGPTPEQIYLRALLEMPAPAVDARRAANRIRAAKPRPRTARPSTALIAATRDLSFESYHFQERLKEHIESVVRIHRSALAADVHKKKLGCVIRRYQKANDRVLRYRNFVVHGPKNRVDEFAELKLAELGAVTLHDDLWFEHVRVFEECKQEWCDMARSLVRSMEASIALIQAENENAIEEGKLTFSKRA